jgi:hypothetical protein
MTIILASVFYLEIAGYEVNKVTSFWAKQFVHV